MSLPDVVLDATMASATSTHQDPCDRKETEVRGAVVCSLDSGLDSSRDGVSEDSGALSREGDSGSSTPCSYHSDEENSPSRPESRSQYSLASLSSYDSVGHPLHFVDDGEAVWDSLGRMGLLRRSSRFDKPRLVTVVLHRGKGGFGLELEGQMPSTVSQVFEEARPSGIRIGDRILEVNGQSVRGLDHEEVGTMIAEGPDEAMLLVHSQKPAPTPDGRDIHTGWLLKRGGSGMTPRNWRRRWFVVKDDCIAYYFASQSDEQPLGAIVLRNYTVSKASHDIRRPFAFKIVKGGARSYYFCADDEPGMNKWAQVMTEAAKLEGRESVHFCSTSHNVSLSALSIKDPDCHGWLYKQGHGIRPWRRRYCVLKSHQLFYYGKMSHRTAYGVLNLRGNRVVRGKSKEKKLCFSIVPGDKSEKEYHFYTETDVERERWMQAMRRAATRQTI